MLKQEIPHPDKKVSTGAYSDAVRVDNDLIFVSGQGPVDFETGAVRRGTVGEETTLTLQHIEKIIKQAGCSLDNIVKTSVHLSKISDFDEFNEAYARFFRERKIEVLPARTTVQSTLWNEIKVEIDCIARL